MAGVVGRSLAVGERAHHLKVFFSNRHVFAQVMRRTDGHILAAAATNEKIMRDTLPNKSDKNAAKQIGKAIAERALAANIPAVHFQKPKGKPFHGKLRCLIESMREAGMKFNYSTLAGTK